MEGIISTKKQTVVQSSDVIIDMGFFSKNWAAEYRYDSIENPDPESNPYANGWYKLVSGNYERCTNVVKDNGVVTDPGDTVVKSGVSYYERVVTQSGYNQDKDSNDNRLYTGFAAIKFNKAFSNPPTVLCSVSGAAQTSFWGFKVGMNTANGGWAPTTTYTHVLCYTNDSDNLGTFKAGECDFNWVAIGT